VPNTGSLKVRELWRGRLPVHIPGSVGKMEARK